MCIRDRAYHEWPKYDEAKCVEQTIEIAVQVNGKVKARLNVAANIESADAIACLLYTSPAHRGG